MRVCAFVITYNRLTLLKECVSCLREQTVKPDSIIIVDNGSNIETANWLREQNDLDVFTIKKNEGAANGFKVAFQYCAQKGYEWAWCMDDDTLPEPEALEKLLAFISSYSNPKEIGFLESKILWVDGSLCKSNLPQFKDKNKSEIKLATFVSTFYNMAAVAEVGLPIAEFYQWYVDAEFTWRIQQKYKCYYVPESKVVHKTKENIAYTWKNVNEEMFDKFSKGLTNFVYLYRNNYYNLSFFENYKTLFVTLVRAYYYTILKTENKINNIKILSSNIKKGLRFKPKIAFL